MLLFYCKPVFGIGEYVILNVIVRVQYNVLILHFKATIDDDKFVL